MRPKTQVIVNPESNQGRTRKRWTVIKTSIKGFIKEFKYEFTEKPLQAIEITRSALKDGSELIIGVGGDGTMNEIANGFFDEKKLINPEATLGIVSSGTGCDFTKSLNIQPGLENALKVITQACSRPIDIGRATFHSHEGRVEERYFLNVSDFGLGGEVIQNLNRRRLERRATSYIRCLVSTMVRYKSKRLRIKIDGQEIADGEYLVGVIANGKIFGKGMKIAPLARLDDGLFDIVMVKGMKFMEFCRHGWKIFRGTHLSHPKISLIRGRTIEAIPEEGVEVLLELDGEQLGTLPATFEINPQRMLVKGYP
jgi:diacylglycerol kinase (ATP)